MTDSKRQTPNHLLREARVRLLGTQQALADAANQHLAPAYLMTGNDIGKIERGVVERPSAPRRRALRIVCRAVSDTEIGFGRIVNDGPGDGRGHRSSAVQDSQCSAPEWARTAGECREDDMDRRAFLKPLAAASIAPHTVAFDALLATLLRTRGPAQDGGPVEPPPIAVIRQRVRAIRAGYQNGRYRSALLQLPEVLSDLRIAQTHDGPDDAMPDVEAEVYQVASGLLLKMDEVSLASVAADRSYTAACTSGDPLTIGASARAVAHTLLAGGHASQASRFATTAAENLYRDGPVKASTEAVALYGALLLRGAICAARAEDRDTVETLLVEAREAASRAVPDGNARGTAFNATNVDLHTVAAAVHLGDAGRALATAHRVDLRAIALRERRAMLLLDSAEAYLMWGKHEQALQAVFDAELHAPEEVRSRSATHRLILRIAEHAPIAVRSRATSYASALGSRPR